MGTGGHRELDDADGRVIAVLGEKLDNLIDNVKGWRDSATLDRQEIMVLVKDHERRLVRIERLYWLIAGAAAFVSPVVVWALIEMIKALT